MQSTQNKNNFIILATPAPISHRTAEENLGLGYLSAVLQKNGFEVKILDAWLNGWTPDELANKILQDKDPLFIGVSAYQSNIDQALKTLDAVKQQKNITFVAGGFGPTFSPDLFLDSGFDFVIRGEGEQAICDLAQALQDKTPVSGIKNLSYKENTKNTHNPIVKLLSPLDDLPIPVRDTVKIAIDKRTPIHLLMARGCTGYCSFCSINSFFRLSKSPKWRGRSIDNIISEMRYLKSLGVQHIKVIDDSFVDGDRDAQWCRDFANKMQEYGLAFDLRGSIRADWVTDEVLAELKRAGFFSFSCGIENFSTTALKRMAKGASVEQNCMALDLFKKHDFYVQAGQILFDPYTTLVELQENYEYMRKYDWIISKGVFTEMFAATGTAFQQKVSRNNIVTSENPVLGNYNYRILDDRAKIAYDALKRWHTVHMAFYDKAIDPLTSPKALTKSEMADFYAEYLKIRQLDLDIMCKILDLVDSNASATTVASFVEKSIENNRRFFYKQESKTDELYRKAHLQYKAAANPFIKVK